jgi:hypothetical protein
VKTVVKPATARRNELRNNQLRQPSRSVNSYDSTIIEEKQHMNTEAIQCGMTDEEIEAECAQILEECRRDAEQRDEAEFIRLEREWQERGKRASERGKAS